MHISTSRILFLWQISDFMELVNMHKIEVVNYNTVRQNNDLS